VSGATGSSGTNGLRGPTGPAGTRGPTGARGPTGIKGATGPTGPQGQTGGTTIWGGTPGTGTISTDNHLAAWYQSGAGSANSTQVPLRAGNMSNVRIALSASPGTGKSWTFQIVKNGSPVAGATAQCAIAATNTTCTISGPVTFQNGDLFAVLADAAGTGSNAPATTSIAFTADYAFSP
jgi:hypothetical protein